MSLEIGMKGHIALSGEAFLVFVPDDMEQIKRKKDKV